MISTEQQFPQHLIIFVRYPRAGKAKTRLIPALGRQGAADLQRIMTEHLLHQLRPTCHDEKICCTLFYTGCSAQEMQAWLGNDLSLQQQQGDNLGQRIQHAFADAKSRGARQTILLGSDCPAVDDNIIRNAFAGLGKHDLVIGPAADGGYYLIGIKSRISSKRQNLLFTDINWGKSDVLQQTIARAQEAKLTWIALPILHDIDRPEDLEHFHYHPSPE